VTARAAVRLGLGIAVAGLFGWLVLRQVRLADIATALRSARPGWLALGLASFFAGYACRIERWRLMLRHDNPAISRGYCTAVLMASVAANNLLPLRAGDLIRAFTFNRRLGISATTSLTTLIVERLLDTLVLVVLLGAAVLALQARLASLLGVGGGVFLALGGAILAVLLAPGAFRPLADRVVVLAGRMSPRAGEHLAGLSTKVFGALLHIAQGHVMLRLLLASVAAWLFEGIVFLCTALALPSVAQPVAAWLALPLGTLATILPSTPGFVGTFDYFTVLAMRSAGNGPAPSTAFALLVHAMVWLPATLAGGVAWLWLGRGPTPEEAQAGT